MKAAKIESLTGASAVARYRVSVEGQEPRTFLHLAEALTEAGWAGHRPAASAPPHRAVQPLALLLHRPGSITHPWAVSAPDHHIDHPTLSGALARLLRLAERGHRPQLGPAAAAAIAALLHATVSERPTIEELRTLAAAAEPNPLDPLAHWPLGLPADLSHPTEIDPLE